MSNVLTAKQFFDEELSGEPLCEEVVIEALINFANIHREAALKAASEKAMVLEIETTTEFDFNEGEEVTAEEKHIHSGGYIRDENWVEVDKESILNAYPKENIK